MQDGWTGTAAVPDFLITSSNPVVSVTAPGGWGGPTRCTITRDKWLQRHVHSQRRFLCPHAIRRPLQFHTQFRDAQSSEPFGGHRRKHCRDRVQQVDSRQW